MLNEQFQSVFTTANNSSNSEFYNQKYMFDSTENYLDCRDILITINGVENKLTNLNPHKAGKHRSMVLKELASEIAPILIYSIFH